MTEDRTAVVLRDLVDGVGIVSLNRPHRHNAIDDDTGAALGDAIDWAAGDPRVRCILLRGEGPSFTSGRDMAVLGHRAQGESDFEFVRRAQERSLALMEGPKPVVAALKGYALGGGFEMALRADLRVAAGDVKLGLPEIRYGLLPDTGGTQILTTLIGPERTKYLVMTGDRIGADEALAWGLVHRIVPVDELDAVALDLARRLAAGPPLALALAKQLVDQVFADAVRRGIRQELVAQTALFASEDYREAKAARLEDRPPVFRGR